MKTESEIEKGKSENQDQVAVVTTSGSWPKEGFEKTPSHQKVRVFVDKAVKELGIVSTNNWVAKVGGREINLEASYIENGLSGEVTIDFGPREGGGGI